jgi:hypothetical protein
MPCGGIRVARVDSQAAVETASASTVADRAG